MSIISLDFYDVYVETYGKPNSPPILFLHGGPGGSFLSFISFAKLLSDKYYVILFDQIGTLRSSPLKIDQSFGMKEHVQYIEKLRSFFRFRSWNIYGHSYGGMLATLYAQLYPQSISRIIYECPAWDEAKIVKNFARLLLPFFQSESNSFGTQLCISILSKEYSSFSNQHFEDFYALTHISLSKSNALYYYKISEQEFNLIYKSLPSKLWGKNFLCIKKIADEGLINHNFLPALKNIHHPSLLISGERDPICDPLQQNYFITNSPSGFLQTIPHSAHYPHYEAPLSTYRAVDSFLSLTFN